LATRQFSKGKCPEADAAPVSALVPVIVPARDGIYAVEGSCPHLSALIFRRKY